MQRSALFLSLFIFILINGTRAADQPDAAALKLREQLRSTMLQLRTVQGERDTLQAEKTTLDAEKKTLTANVEKLTKQAIADKDASEKAIAKLTDKSTAQEAELTQLKESLEKWKASHQQAVTLAQQKEDARASAAQEVIVLKRKVADQQTRNLAMYKVGKEILAKYEGFGLGTAVTAREPFTGLMKVKLENLVQDYGDKLDAERLKPEPPPAGAMKPAAQKKMEAAQAKRR
jgi:DNA repair exonuclease SbcCD ATPase subunit